jgi:hypothetical protein
MDGLRKKYLPVKMSFAIKRNIEAMADIIKSIEEERQNIIMRTKANPQLLADKINELLDIETIINIDTISIADLEKTEGEGYDLLSLGEIEAIGFMIEE